MKHLYKLACSAAFAALIAATPSNAASVISGPNTVSLDRTDDFSWAVNYAATSGTNLPGTTGTISFNFLSANVAGTAWNFSYAIDNTSTGSSAASRLGVFGFDVAPNVTSAVTLSTDLLTAALNGGNFNGLGNREVCFYAGPNCNGSGRNGVTVDQAPAMGTFTLNVAATDTLIINNFAARWQATGVNANGSNSGAGVIAAVPEPGTWAMMMVGFAMIGTAARYRRRATKVAYA